MGRFVWPRKAPARRPPRSPTMADESTSPRPVVAYACPACGSEIAPNLLSCPSCHRLVHADRLKGLAGSAEAAARAGEVGAALASWREALTLLPPESRQYAVIADRIGRLGRQVEAGGFRSQSPSAPSSQAQPSESRDG